MIKVVRNKMGFMKDGGPVAPAPKKTINLELNFKEITKVNLFLEK
jgi:hypothetical protein